MRILRSPGAKATPWHVRRQIANHNQAWRSLRRTNDQCSSNSSTSSVCAGSRVVCSGGSCAAFCYPGNDGGTRHAKRAGHAAQAAPFLIRTQDRGAFRCRGAVRLRVLTVLPTTRATHKPLVARRCMAVFINAVLAQNGQVRAIMRFLLLHQNNVGSFYHEPLPRNPISKVVDRFIGRRRAIHAIKQLSAYPNNHFPSPKLGARWRGAPG